MNIELPLYKQEKVNTCALACLRMVLAIHGVDVKESELEARVVLKPKGTFIGDLERLARSFYLIAEIRIIAIEDFPLVLKAGGIPIAYVDRAIFDLSPGQRARHSLHDAKIHNVIPVRLTRKSITFHDPLPPAVTRKSIRLFRRAYDSLGSTCLLCAGPRHLSRPSHLPE